MYIYDFEYDGQLLSDLGYIVCSFDSGGGIDNTRAGSEVTFNTVPTHSGKRYISTGTKYDKCLSTTLQICKDPEKFDVNERRITDEEFRALSRWLNRREYKWYRNNIASLYNKTATASGAVASFNDGAEGIPVKSLLIGIEPLQSGSGDPSPENVRPITGWTGATVTRAGKNLLKTPYYDNSKTVSGIEFTVLSDGSLKIYGTNTGASTVYFNFSHRSNGPMPLKKGTYTIPKTGATGVTFACCERNAENTEVHTLATATATSDKSFTIDHDALTYSYVAVVSGTTVDTILYPQLEFGSTATPYEPYTAEDILISFPSEAGTVYGGTLDVTSGVLTVDRLNVDLGSLSWSSWNDGNSLIFNVELPGKTQQRANADCISSMYKYRGNVSVWSNLLNGEMTGNASNQRIYIRNTAYNDNSTFKAGMSGVQIVYTLATPITYQLTPQEVLTLLGPNSILADAGNISVEYRVNDECIRQSTIGYVPTWFNASFNLSRIEIGSECYGVELNMTTDSPFGYGDERAESIAFAAGSLTKTFTDENDEIGDTYPEMEITCRQSGDLTLTDDVTGCSFEVDNCVNGEVITLSGDTMIISTSVSTHDIANDFNYDFFHFGNTFYSRENTVTASIPCDIVMRYKPIIKDTL